MSKLCDDCKSVPATMHYVLGKGRCDACAKVFDDAWRAKRRAEKEAEAKALEAHKVAGCPDDGVVCPECCEHEYDWDEGGMCLNCGDQGDFGAVIDHAMEAYGGDR